MFTSEMYNRLSEWTGNISILSVGSILGSLFTGQQVTLFGLVVALGFSFAALWISLRLARIAEERRT